MAFLPSEICRLVLGFLEEENYKTTFDAFLNECKYLEECKLYLTRDIRFCKTIHGKSLTQHLLSNCPVERQTRSTQTSSVSLTDDAAQTDAPQPTPQVKQVKTSDAAVQSDTVDVPVPVEPAAQLQPVSAEQNTTTTTTTAFGEQNTTAENVIPDYWLPSKRKSARMMANASSRKRKPNILRSPVKQKPAMAAVAAAFSADLPDNQPSDIEMDLDVFIQSLCSNEIPEKLARSINNMYLKKLANANGSFTCDETSNASNPPMTSKAAAAIESVSFAQQTSIPSTSTSFNACQFSFGAGNLPTVHPEAETSSQMPVQPLVSAQEPCMHTENYQPSNDLNFGFGDSVLGLESALFDKFIIDNEDISLLAEEFSGPVFVSLFEDIGNAGGTNSCMPKDQATTPPAIKSGNEYEAIPEDDHLVNSQIAVAQDTQETQLADSSKETNEKVSEDLPKPDQLNQSNEAEKAVDSCQMEVDSEPQPPAESSATSSPDEALSQTAIEVQPEKEELKSLEEKESSVNEVSTSVSKDEFEPKCLTTRDRTSFIIIAKKQEDIQRIEKQIASGDYSSATASTGWQSNTPDERTASSTSTPTKTSVEQQDPLGFQFDSSLDETEMSPKHNSSATANRSESPAESKSLSNPPTPTFRGTNSPTSSSPGSKQPSQYFEMPKDECSSQSNDTCNMNVATPCMRESQSHETLAYSSPEEAVKFAVEDGSPKNSNASPAKSSPRRSKTVRELLYTKSPTSTLMYELNEPGQEPSGTPVKQQQSAGTDITFDEIMLMSMFKPSRGTDEDKSPRARKTVAELTKPAEAPKPEVLFKSKETTNCQSSVCSDIVAAPSTETTNKDKTSPASSSPSSNQKGNQAKTKRNQYFGDIFNKINLSNNKDEPKQPSTPPFAEAKPPNPPVSSAKTTNEERFPSLNALLQTSKLAAKNPAKPGMPPAVKRSESAAVSSFKEEWTNNSKDLNTLVKHCRAAETNAKSKLKTGNRR